MDPRHAQNTCPKHQAFSLLHIPYIKYTWFPFFQMFFQNYTFNHPTNLHQTQGVPLGQMFHCPKHGWELEVFVCWVSATPSAKNPQKKREPQFSVGFHGKGFATMELLDEGIPSALLNVSATKQDLLKRPFERVGQSVLFMNLMAKSHFLRNSFIVIQYLDTFVSSRVFHPRHIWRRPGDELKELLGFVKETMGRWDGEKHYVKMMVERFLAMITTTRLFFGKMKAQAIDKFWTTILDLLF